MCVFFNSGKTTFSFISLQKMLAVPLVIFLFQHYVMNKAYGGAYYGPKQPPQQPQPIPQYSDDFPQLQFLGNEMPHSPFSKNTPPLRQYGKEARQLPLPLQIGKMGPLTKGKGDVFFKLNRTCEQSTHLRSTLANAS